ncbi:MAG: hypothetical protein VX724_04635 [Chloroflexota bacterium]|nr:hypothetical protein [Chloroflexota bacterium]
MGVHHHLINEERIVLQWPPFYLTTHRLLRCEDVLGNESFREIPIQGIKEVEMLRETDHKIMSLGLVLVVSGVILIATWGLLTAFLGVVAGIIALFLGSRGKIAGYQIKSDRIPDREFEMWLLPRWGTENFVRKLRVITVENETPNLNRN